MSHKERGKKELPSCLSCEVDERPEHLMVEDGILKHDCEEDDNMYGIIDPEGYCRMCGYSLDDEGVIRINDKEEYKDKLNKYTNL